MQPARAISPTAERRAPASDARQRGRAPGAGLRHAARQGEKIITATVAARTHATRERAQASRARGNRGGTQTRRAPRAHTPPTLHPPHRSGVLALLFTTYTFFSLKGEPTGKDVGRPLVDKYGAMIKDGAMAFLKEEYKWLSVFVVLLGGILCALFSVEDQHTKLDGVLTTFAFFLGAILMSASAWGAWLGMMVATDGNTRTTAACAGKEVKDAQGKVTGGLGRSMTACASRLKPGASWVLSVGATQRDFQPFPNFNFASRASTRCYHRRDAVDVAVQSGSRSVSRVVDAGLGLVGCAGCFCILAAHQGLGKTESLQILAGFGFGASSIALFARVAGGIYTKAADVGADLVGKVEAGIDEDDPHNPAVIADNVGDNVGDVAGHGRRPL